jgi:hypothetical protein
LVAMSSASTSALRLLLYTSVDATRRHVAATLASSRARSARRSRR